jgi:hypothetical protein
VKTTVGLASSALSLVVLLVAAGTPAAARAAKPLVAHQEPGLGQLLVPADRIELSYKLDSKVKSPTGLLSVRSDLQRRFQRLPMRLTGNPLKGGATFRARLPARFLRGHRLVYYAVIRDLKSGRSVTLSKRSAWALRKPVVIKLGTHAFGQTRTPDAVVAHASAADVAWDNSESFHLGPQAFQVGTDGSVWLQDSFNNRLLRWNQGQPDHFASSVPLPGFAGSGDFVLGPRHTIYATGPGLLGYDPVLFRVSSTGSVLWSEPLPGVLKGVGQLPLRIGPDGSVYCGVNWVEFGKSIGEYGWMPVATPGGKAVAPASQLRRTAWGYQPLAGGLRLVSGVYTPPRSEKGPLDVRYALIDGNGRVRRSWRILSRTEIFPGGPPFFTPELVGGDPVVDLEVVSKPGTLEHVVLRLGSHGTRDRLSVPFAVWGDELYADLRVGPDGNLYNLATSPTSGVTISRYSLASS